ncbi:MAG: hypothetical protein QGF81_05385, partial [Dehalococcoidia bacterium]|nr:hypothetical protein [Dehalococcoidia bacterium]
RTNKNCGGNHPQQVVRRALPIWVEKRDSSESNRKDTSKQIHKNEGLDKCSCEPQLKERFSPCPNSITPPMPTHLMYITPEQ